MSIGNDELIIHTENCESCQKIQDVIDLIDCNKDEESQKVITFLHNLIYDCYINSLGNE